MSDEKEVKEQENDESTFTGDDIIRLEKLLDGLKGRSTERVVQKEPTEEERLAQEDRERIRREYETRTKNFSAGHWRHKNATGEREL